MNPIVVGIAEFRFAEPPRKLVTYGLGSCVAITLFSRQAAVGAMAHVMLPLAYGSEGDGSAGKFADSAVAAMVREMGRRGIGPAGLEAKMAGGADMFAGHFEGTGRRIGARNILATLKALNSFQIRLLSQDVGGNAGRTVEFDLMTGILLVRTIRGGEKEL